MARHASMVLLFISAWIIIWTSFYKLISSVIIWSTETHKWLLNSTHILNKTNTGTKARSAFRFSKIHLPCQHQMACLILCWFAMSSRSGHNFVSTNLNPWLDSTSRLIHFARIGVGPPRLFTSQAKGCGENSQVGSNSNTGKNGSNLS